MTISLQGRAAVISGAGGGIGRALVHRALEEGMRVYAWDLDQGGLSGLPNEVRRRTIDVRDAAEVARAAEDIRQDDIQIALLFANAGVLEAGRSWEMDAAAWQRVICVNILGVTNMLSAFVPDMIGQKLPSRIVVTASQSAFLARAGNAAYSSSKHALWGLAEALRDELRDIDAPVGVTMLAPGPVRTGLAATARGGEAMDQALQAIGVEPKLVADLAFAAIAEDRFCPLGDDIKQQLADRIRRLTEE